MMSGHTNLHEQLQNELAAFVNKQAAYLLNFGYQNVYEFYDGTHGGEDAFTARGVATSVLLVPLQARR